MNRRAFLFAAAAAHAQSLQPIPRVQAIPLPGSQVSFQVEEREIARLYHDPALPRPFVYPIIGPSGRTLTRMGHPGDPAGHSHHNSVWISLSDVSGTDFWSDTGGGRIRHSRVEHLEDGTNHALAITDAHWLDKGDRVLLRERRHTVVRLRDKGQWLLDIHLRLEAVGRAMTLPAPTFGPIGVRMAKYIGAYHGGGKLRNSEGAEGEPAIFRKPARWVDYSGQVAPGVVEGITLLDHPSNPRHPSPFHVREDGWMGAMLALDKPFVMEPGKPVEMRWGLYIHAGIPTLADLSAVWAEYAKTPLRVAYGPPKSARECAHGEHKRFTQPTFASAAECTAFVKSKR